MQIQQNAINALTLILAWGAGGGEHCARVDFNEI